MDLCRKGLSIPSVQIGRRQNAAVCKTDFFHNIIILMVLMIPLMCISKSYQY